MSFYPVFIPMGGFGGVGDKAYIMLMTIFGFLFGMLMGVLFSIFMITPYTPMDVLGKILLCFGGMGACGGMLVGIKTK